MISIVRKPERAAAVHFERFYEYRHEPGRGFAFPCDASGRVNPERLTEAARHNYRRCQTREVDVLDRGVRRVEYTYVVPPLGLCECNHEVPLDDTHNVCTGCGRAYDSAGKLIQPPQPDLEDPLACWQEDLATARA